MTKNLHLDLTTNTPALTETTHSAAPNAVTLTPYATMLLSTGLAPASASGLGTPPTSLRRTTVWAAEPPLRRSATNITFHMPRPLSNYVNATLRVSLGGAGSGDTCASLASLMVAGHAVVLNATVQIAGPVRRAQHTNEFLVSQAVPLPAAILAGSSTLLSVSLTVPCVSYMLVTAVLDVWETANA